MWCACGRRSCAQFSSAASDALKRAVRAELLQLWDRSPCATCYNANPKVSAAEVWRTMGVSAAEV